LVLLTATVWVGSSCAVADHLKELQTQAAQSGRASWGHWGTDPQQYSHWKNHSNRLIPVYTFGIALEAVGSHNSIYRNADRLQKLYGRLPEATLNPDADYFDQTDVYHLQIQAAQAGKKFIVLIIFDGMDWQTTWAAAIHKSGAVGYRQGRGTGLVFQDYRGVPTDFGYCVTSPFSDSESVDVNAQVVLDEGGTKWGGYDAKWGGQAPWVVPQDRVYLLGKYRQRPHAYTDSASAATSFNAGIKTYNRAINMDPRGKPVATVAHYLQANKGYSIGVVTSVPISHATPAAVYAHNVSRDDYQDLTRDLVGLPSIARRAAPLAGVDVLLGCGWGENVSTDNKQGANFIPGNKYIADEDLKRIDVENGGRYRVVQRTAGQNGDRLLAAAARDAAQQRQRLFGLFGVEPGHLPFQTADGNFDPVADVKAAEQYSVAEIQENPTLADMTRAALEVLATNPRGFWLMVEAGDVDWANHKNNLDNSVGAVLSGDDAFHAVTQWAEANQCWDETAVIVTADHGHYLVINRPEELIAPRPD
jgi:alkaline phosphatase